MKRMFRAFVAISMFCAFFASTAGAFEVGLKGSLWYPALSGNVRMDAQGVPGTDLDVDSDLNFSTEVVPGVEGFFGVGKHRLSLAYNQADYTGYGRIRTDVSFNGVEFTAFTDLTSKLEYSMWDLQYSYKFLDLENILAGFSLRAIVHGKYLDGKLYLSNEQEKSEDSFSEIIPLVGAGIRLGFLADILSADAQFTGISYSGDTVMDGYIELVFSPIPLVSVHGGYRFVSLDTGWDKTSMDLTMKGVYAYVGLSF